MDICTTTIQTLMIESSNHKINKKEINKYLVFKNEKSFCDGTTTFNLDDQIHGGHLAFYIFGSEYVSPQLKSHSFK